MSYRLWTFVIPAILLGFMTPGTGLAQEEIYVTDTNNSSVKVYSRTANGNAAPLRIISGPATALQQPVDLVVDETHNEIIVVNACCPASIVVHDRSANGNAPPRRVLLTTLGSFSSPAGVALDLLHDELVVLDFDLRIYARTASGGQTPLRTISGAATKLNGFNVSVAVDPGRDEIFVATLSNGLVVHDRTAVGNVVPVRWLPGGVGNNGIALDIANGELFVTGAPFGSLGVRSRLLTGPFLREIFGSATGLATPRAVAIDGVHDEVLVVDDFLGTISSFRRTDTGNVPPLRKVGGPASQLSAPGGIAVTTTAAPPTSIGLAAAVLPSSRAVPTGIPAAAFASILAAGTGTALGCGIAALTSVPAAFSYQTTSSANVPVGTPNTPVNIPAGGLQTYVLVLTPTAPFVSTDIQFTFDCTNTSPAANISGVNTLLLTATAGATPDIIALGATLTGDGIVNIPAPNGTGVFAVATSNVGASSAISVVADTGGAVLPVVVSLCSTNPATGACLTAPAAAANVQINAGQTPTFSVFVRGVGTVPFDPALNRIFVRFKTTAGTTVGSTSAALRTQ